MTDGSPQAKGVPMAPSDLRDRVRMTLLKGRLAKGPTGEVALASRAGKLQAYLKVPDGDGPWPGVVVIHDVLGQTSDSRRQTDWLASAGYLSIAPDLYSRGGRLFCVRSVMRQVTARSGPAFDDIEAARLTLVKRNDCTGKVGVIGFCMGGGFALLAAARKSFAAASVNYGKVPEDAETLLRGACPIVGSFGGSDPNMKGAAARLERAMRANGIDHDVREYPDTGHAFLNHHGGLTGWVMKRIGITHGFAETDTRQRILAFFAGHLR